MYVEMGIIIVSIAAIILTRSAYRLLNPQWRNTDAFVHFNIIKEIQRNNHQIPEKHSQSFHPGRFTYPILIHILLSFFPERYYETIDRLFSPIVDLLFVALLISLVPVGILDVSEVAVVLGLFVATPQFVRPDHPHGVGLSSRKPGVLLFSVGIVTFLSWTATDSVVFLLTAVLAGSLLPLTSRFSMQAFFFIVLGLSVFYTPLAGMYFIGSVILALVISGGYYWRVLRAHVLYAADYAREKQYKKLYDGFRSIYGIRMFLIAVWNQSPKNALQVVFDSVLFRSVFENIFIIPAIAIALVGVPATVPEGYLIWFYAGFGVYVLTSLYHLRFLGHAGRYLEHIFVPGAVIVASAFGESSTFFDWVVYGTILVGIATIVTYVIIQKRWTDQSERKDFLLLLERLRTLPSGRILMQPRYKGSEIAWKTNHVVNDFLGAGFDTSACIAKRNRLYPEKEGWVTDDTDWLELEFDPDWILFDRTTADNAPSNALSEPERDPQWESDTYALYRFEF
jgi:hypothetical protein